VHLLLALSQRGGDRHNLAGRQSSRLFRRSV